MVGLHRLQKRGVFAYGSPSIAEMILRRSWNCWGKGSSADTFFNGRVFAFIEPSGCMQGNKDLAKEELSREQNISKASGFQMLQCFVGSTGCDPFRRWHAACFFCRRKLFQERVQHHLPWKQKLQNLMDFVSTDLRRRMTTRASWVSFANKNGIGFR